MYLRTKKIPKKYKGKIKMYTYYYLVEYCKKDEKIRQKMVLYLGNANKIKKVFDFYKEHRKD